MGIELPRELAGLAGETGLEWPDADEDKLREQAGAWRDAHRELTALAAEADEHAGAAVAALSRDAGEAAGHAWSAFVDPENGHLTAAARGAAEAADRLETAAEQVGAAKVELVRQLVEAAKNRDATLAAAEHGHPTAILGVEPILRGTAANLAVVTHGLAATLGPGPVGSLVTPVVEPNPGARTPDGQGALLGVVTGLAPELVAPVVTPSPAVLGTAPPAAPAVVSSAVLTPPVVPPVVPEPAFADTDTGPIQLPDPPTPPSLPQYEGLLDAGGFDEVPTPSTGLPNATVAAGFAEAAVPSPPPVGAPGMPGAPAPAAPAAGYAPAGYAPAPYAPAAPAAGYAPPAGHAPFAPGPRQPNVAPYAEPAPPRAPEPPPMGTPRQERETIVALFRVHMFPIGHLPVATDKPARQLPVRPSEVDYAPGLRFPPHDHPRSDLVRTDDALAKVQAGYGRLPSPAGTPPAELLAGYDPLGGLHERDWDRRFLAGKRREVPEYAWPPGELYPEGGAAEGEPEVLAEGAVLDRFGDPRGRVFAPAGTPFARRSLPPSARTAGYRRYRVLRDTPVWRAVSAPWFGQPGGGERYRATYSADELVTLGYLADITFEEGAAQ
ncbi:TNT domain-containing protein [Amycolatopsis ruanii]|uniref:TNT domain-containing protein n=1 Tax=Amycolatopsis ruanii TaxID=944491 RepID=UPI000E24C18E|nr:TNT domain-containing protein [Amycolatopsis ruanii]